MTGGELPWKLTAEQWDMPGPLGPMLRVPVSTVYLHHTVTNATTRPVDDARHVARIGVAKFGRMSYSALIHPRRVIFWAQGAHVGAHTLGANNVSVGLALVGNYDRDIVTDELVYDACVALHDLRAVGVVSERPLVLPHSAVKQTACPGRGAMRKVLPMLREVAAHPSWTP